MAEADFVSIHTPKTPETVGLFGRDLLAKAKPGIRIVNTARGGIVDEEALAEAIRDGIDRKGAGPSGNSAQPSASDCPEPCTRASRRGARLIRMGEPRITSASVSSQISMKRVNSSGAYWPSPCRRMIKSNPASMPIR